MFSTKLNSKEMAQHLLDLPGPEKSVPTCPDPSRAQKIPQVLCGRSTSPVQSPTLRVTYCPKGVLKSRSQALPQATGNPCSPLLTRPVDMVQLSGTVQERHGQGHLCLGSSQISSLPRQEYPSAESEDSAPGRGNRYAVFLIVSDSGTDGKDQGLGDLDHWGNTCPTDDASKASWTPDFEHGCDSIGSG